MSLIAPLFMALGLGLQPELQPQAIEIVLRVPMSWAVQAAAQSLPDRKRRLAWLDPRRHALVPGNQHILRVVRCPPETRLH